MLVFLVFIAFVGVVNGNKKGNEMGINVTIDDKLVKQAKKLTGLTDDSAAVEQMLQQQFVANSEKPRDLRDLAGKFEFYEGFDPIELRKDRDFSD